MSLVNGKFSGASNRSINTHLKYYHLSEIMQYIGFAMVRALGRSSYAKDACHPPACREDLSAISLHYLIYIGKVLYFV